MPERRTGELTPAEARACVLYCQGYSKTEAYCQAFERLPPQKELRQQRASRLFAKPAVTARIKALLDAAKPQDLLSIGKWLEQVKHDTDTARADGNHNAVMNGNRLLGQALGALKDNVSMTVEQRSDDAELVKAIAGADKAAAAALQRALGAKEGFDA